MDAIFTVIKRHRLKFARASLMLQTKRTETEANEKMPCGDVPNREMLLRGNSGKLSFRFICLLFVHLNLEVFEKLGSMMTLLIKITMLM